MNASRDEMKKKPARVALAVGVEEAVLEVAAEPQVVAAHRHRDELGVLQRPVVGLREALRPAYCVLVEILAVVAPLHA
jgi:hypothetical protein